MRDKGGLNKKSETFFLVKRRLVLEVMLTPLKHIVQKRARDTTQKQMKEQDHMHSTQMTGSQEAKR